MIFTELLVRHSHMPWQYLHAIAILPFSATCQWQCCWKQISSSQLYHMRRCGHDYHCFMIFFLISSDNILLLAFRLQLGCAQGVHVTVKSFGRLFSVSWLCFTPTFSTLSFKNILCSYVLYTHRCFSPVQLYYPLRLSPSLKTRRRRAAG